MHKKTLDLLEKFTSNTSWFEVFIHEPVRTSEEASKIRHGYHLGQGAKALIVKSGDKFSMIVVPGDKKFDSTKVKAVLGSKELRFATEAEVLEITEGILLGGIPPFGSLFGIQTFADSSVLKNEKIIFNCADKCISVALYAKDYMTIEKPVIVEVL